MAPSISSNGVDHAPSNMSNGTSHNESDEIPKDEMLETEFLVVGAGPAGAALACFLTSYGEYLFSVENKVMVFEHLLTEYLKGFKGIMISAAPGTANTPRAHITNMAALGPSAKSQSLT